MRTNLGLVFAIAVVSIVVAAFVFGGAPVKLTCRRLERAGQVNCTRQTIVLGIFPLREERFEGIRGASVDMSEGGGGEYASGPTYRVELATSSGAVPLRTVYTSDSSPKEEAAQRINTFVQSKQVGTLTLTEPGMLSVGNLFCMGIWLVLYILWAGIKKIFSFGSGH